jgi:hypothetical protein
MKNGRPLHWLRGYEAFLLGKPMQQDNVYYLFDSDMTQEKIQFKQGWLRAELDDILRTCYPENLK